MLRIRGTATMTYSYVTTSHVRRHRGTGRRTPLGRAVEWLSEKTLNEALDFVLRLFLNGEWHVRLAGAVVTGIVAASTVWLAAGTVLPALLGGATAATAIGLGAVAGAAMGGIAGVPAGAGAAWLMTVLADAVGADLTKDQLGLHVAPWVAWCLATVVGGLAGWVVGRAAGWVERRSRVAGLVLRTIACLLILAAIVAVSIGTGAAGAVWRWLAALFG